MTAAAAALILHQIIILQIPWEIPVTEVEIGAADEAIAAAECTSPLGAVACGKCSSSVPSGTADIAAPLRDSNRRRRSNARATRFAAATELTPRACPTSARV